MLSYALLLVFIFLLLRDYKKGSDFYRFYSTTINVYWIRNW